MALHPRHTLTDAVFQLHLFGACDQRLCITTASACARAWKADTKAKVKGHRQLFCTFRAPGLSVFVLLFLFGLLRGGLLTSCNELSEARTSYPYGASVRQIEQSRGTMCWAHEQLHRSADVLRISGWIGPRRQGKQLKNCPRSTARGHRTPGRR